MVLAGLLRFFRGNKVEKTILSKDRHNPQIYGCTCFGQGYSVLVYCLNTNYANWYITFNVEF